MKYAASIRYGGQLISADECDYNSYKHLGLLCPCEDCKEPVFLRAANTRQQHGKEVAVSAHFAHFASKDPALAAKCEERVKRFDEKELLKRAASAKGQRLKLLHRWFWAIFAGYYGRAVDFPVAEITETQQPLRRITQNGTNLIQVSAEIFREWNKEAETKRVTHIFEGLKDGSLISIGESANDSTPLFLSVGVQKAFQESVNQKIDLRMQQMICFEVLNFLRSRSSTPLVEDLVVLGFGILLDAMADGAVFGGIPGTEIAKVRHLVDPETGKATKHFGVNTQILCSREVLPKAISAVMDHIYLWICCLPWAQEFELLQAKTKGGKP